MFKILDCVIDAKEWDEAFASLSPTVQDVHFTSAYARVQLTDGRGGRAICAAQFVGEHGLVMQPFRMMPIYQSPYWDLTSLYGFGGPVGLPSLTFAQDLREWAIEQGVVSEFCTLHPLLFENQLPVVANFPVNVEWVKDTVVVEDLKTYGPKRTSRKVRRAMENICGDKPDPVMFMANYCDKQFGQLYRMSMERLKAEDRWLFPQEYWTEHFNHSDLNAEIFAVIDQNTNVARRALLTIGHGSTAYAHFLGSDGKERDKGLDEFLYNIVIYNLGNNPKHGWNYERVHLGGGLTDRADDSLLRFKLGFSKTTYRVGVYRRVFMPGVYLDLNAARAALEERECGRLSTAKWFPEYRRGFE